MKFEITVQLKKRGRDQYPRKNEDNAIRNTTVESYKRLWGEHNKSSLKNINEY